jgi:hypothetical protein
MTLASIQRPDLAASGLDGWQYTGSGLLVPARTQPRYDRPVGVGLFSGAGGLDPWDSTRPGTTSPPASSSTTRQRRPTW